MLQRRLIQLSAGAAACTLAAAVHAEPFDVDWFTIDCGGETSAAGQFELSGSIGQPDAGLLTGSGFELSGGFMTVIDAPGCGSADFNCDGDIGTDGDIEAFFACLSGNCPAAPCAGSADFNADGDVGTDGDIEAFFRACSRAGSVDDKPISCSPTQGIAHTGALRSRLLLERSYV